MTRLHEADFFRVGIYSLAEAARLTEVSSTRIRRWIAGYDFSIHGKLKLQPPVWRTRIPLLDEFRALGFDDLIEVRFVAAFVRAGVLLQRIRRAIRELQKIEKVEYPLSRKRIFTDGKEIFTRLEVDGKPLLYELTGSRNYAFFDVVWPNLVKEVLFGEQGSAFKWYPDETAAARIAVSPAVAFGRPVVDGTRIQASVLANAVRTENSIDRVAEWYEIDPVAVSQAVSFEARFHV